MIKMIKIMKAIKQLLIAIGLISVLTISAQTITEYPVAEMHSTSTLVGSGSNLPNAASSGFISADDNLNSSNFNTPRGPRRVIDEDDKEEEKPEGWQDPMEDPIGDAILPMMLLAVVYGIYLRRKKCVRIPDSGHQQ
jgi:hypothetical protein